MDAGIGVGLEVDTGLSAGSGYVNGEFELKLGNTHKGTGEGVSASIGGGREEDGPSVSVSSETDNGWDFHMTLNRNLDSSLDPALAGRPGDVILGGGFEIVYVMSDILDFDDNCLSNSNDHLVSSQTYELYHQRFTIEDKILPELEHLRDGILDGTVSNTDTVLEGESKTTDESAAIWAIVTTSITDWTNTMNWTSPDFNPDWTTSESESSRVRVS